MRGRTVRHASMVRASMAASAGLFGLGIVPAHGASPIDTNQAFYLQSQIGSTVLPDFQGGTLRDNQASVTDTYNYTVENFTTNTIDAFGHSALFNGTFSGAGPLTIVDSVGGGTVALAGVETYTGATTINSGATLQLGGGGTTGTVAGPITDNGLLTFDYSGPLTVDSTISGSGDIEIVAGTVVETSASLIGGTVTIDNGATLQWGNSN